MTSKLASVDDKYPAHQVLANIEQLTVGMDLHNGQELMVADVHFRDQQPFLKLLAGIGTPINPTTWTVFGAGLRAILLADRHWCLTLGAPDVAYRPRAQALPPISVTHDIGIRFDIKGLIGTLRAATEMPDAASLPQDMILTGGVDVGAMMCLSLNFKRTQHPLMSRNYYGCHQAPCMPLRLPSIARCSTPSGRILALIRLRVA